MSFTIYIFSNFNVDIFKVKFSLKFKYSSSYNVLETMCYQSKVGKSIFENIFKTKFCLFYCKTKRRARVQSCANF